jgi:hypothetical protein
MLNILRKIARDDPTAYFTADELISRFPGDADSIKRGLHYLTETGDVERVMKLYRAAPVLS